MVVKEEGGSSKEGKVENKREREGMIAYIGRKMRRDDSESLP